MASPHTPSALKVLKDIPSFINRSRDCIRKIGIATNELRKLEKNNGRGSESIYKEVVGDTLFDLSISSPKLCPVHNNLNRNGTFSFCRVHHFISSATVRRFSTLGRDEPALEVDPYKLIEPEMAFLANDIKKIVPHPMTGAGYLNTEEDLLKTMSHYYFNGKGKTFRPLVALLMSKACNISTSISDSILSKQKTVAIVAEMIHTASLVHDDVIDGADTRRGQSSLNKLYGQRKSILVGDYILSQASIALAQTGNPQVITILSSVLEDLVSGEFMQLGSKEDENERFTHYLKKTYKKTASLIANACKAVAVLAKCNEHMAERAYQYGRNLGIAFQLVDDLLDFVSNELVMGKPTSADLKLGLATAPVLFAAQEYPELHPMIMRRFTINGDVETARYLVAKSDGVQQTKLLASQHSKEAIRNLQDFTSSEAKTALECLAKILLERKS